MKIRSKSNWDFCGSRKSLTATPPPNEKSSQLRRLDALRSDQLGHELKLNN